MLSITLAVLWATIVFPFVARGGFVCDDWMVLAHAAEHPTWWANYSSWFPLFAARPLAPAVLATASALLPESPAAYISFHLLLLALAMGSVALLWRRFFGAGAAAGFFILAMLPSVASTLIFSPGMQQLASAAYLVWAVSMLLTVAAVEARTRRRRIGLAIAVAVLLLVGLVLYEIFLPLLMVQLALPIALQRKKAEEDGSEAERPLAPVSLRDTIFWAALIAVPVLTAAILQKWIVPAFAPDMSRLQFGGPGMTVRAVAYWFTAVLVQLPLLWADGLVRFIEAWDWLTLTAAIAFLAVLLYFGRDGLHEDPSGVLHNQVEDEPNSKSASCREADRAARLMRIACWGAAAGSLALFVLSNSYAAVFGYDNRKLSSFWVACALAVSSHLGGRASAASHVRFTTGQAVFLSVFLLNTTSFLLQRNNYLLSWHVQQTILEDMATSLPTEQDRPLTVLAAVPPVVPGNLNDECVFTRPWDIGNASRMRTRGRIRDAAPIYPWLLRQNRVRFAAEAVVIDELWTSRYDDNLWLFGWRLSAGRIKPLPRRFLGMALLPAYRFPRLSAVAVWIPIASQEELQSALHDWFQRHGAASEMSRPARVTQSAAEWFRSRFPSKTSDDRRQQSEKPST
ncbi:MAG: hypothetical protein ACUVTW_05365 [Thermogutta sp.]